MKILRHIRSPAFVFGVLVVAFAVLVVAGVIYNRLSKTRFSQEPGMDFSIHTPLKGTSSEWQIKHRAPLVIVMAPREVQVSPQFNVSLPFLPTDTRQFQFLTINLIPKKYDKTIVDACRQLISGTKLYDENYQVTDPELAVISGNPSAFFQESLVINGSPARGIAYLVPCARGYYLLSFRADAKTYNESFYKRIAGTFRCKEQ